MFTVAFYSFKGGAGRTLLLANAACALAAQGKRVLVVDFDLESPGLDTVLIGENEEGQPGLLDYITDGSDGRALPLDAYVYSVEVAGSDGSLAVMPAGMRGPDYARRLSQVDWQDLYAHGPGFALFEELRDGANSLGFDYLLIDARTGFADTVGISTRQLADLVVFVFFPAPQAIRGIKVIADQVRNEHRVSGGPPTSTLFVASNLPTADDEQDVFAQRLGLMGDALDGDRLYSVHHYDSWEFIEKPLVVQERPSSRLAREYGKIVQAIRESNDGDVEGVLSFLREAETAPERVSLADRLHRWDDLEARHRSNGEVLYALARSRLHYGFVDRAVDLTEQALNHGYSTAETNLIKAEALRRLGDEEESGRAAEQVLISPDADADAFIQAIEILRWASPGSINVLPEAPALPHLDPRDQVAIAGLLDQSPDEHTAAKTLLENLISQNRPDTPPGEAEFALGTSLTALGRFAEARAAFTTSMEKLPNDIGPAFNFAIANWGLDGTPDPNLFRAALAKQMRPVEEMDPNYRQALAVARHITGDTMGARLDLKAAGDTLFAWRGQHFSCWSFTGVSAERFRSDLEEIREWFLDEHIKPRFMTRPLG